VVFNVLVDCFGFFEAGSGNNERDLGLIDKDGIDFFDDLEIMIFLDLFFEVGGKVVLAEVIEAELRRNPVCNIASVLLIALK
jgi:hypothetical protein